MSDAELRDLARRAAAGGPEDAARYLQGRVRAGDLDPERLALAAHLGDPAARLARGDAAEAEADDHAPGPEPWFLELRRWGQAAFARGALAAVRAVVERAPRRPSREAAERVLDAGDAWTAHPCPEHARAVRELLEAPLVPPLLHTVALRGNPREWEVVGAAKAAAGHTQPEWVAEVQIELIPDLARTPERQATLLARLEAEGASATWAPGGSPTLLLADCGPLGAAGVTRLLASVSALELLEVLERARRVRERSSLIGFASLRVGEAIARAAIRDALVLWALDGPVSGP